MKKKNVQKIFEDEIYGYHTTSKSPLKETMWEEINANIMRPFCSISEEAMGNHKSGIDNKLITYDYASYFFCSSRLIF